MMTQGLLPAEFFDLHCYVGKWDHPGTNERYAERLSSHYPELEEFHAIFGARLADVKAHLDKKAFCDYSDADRRLARLAWSWVIVAEAVEVFKQARVPDSKMYWDIQVEAEI